LNHPKVFDVFRPPTPYHFIFIGDLELEQKLMEVPIEGCSSAHVYKADRCRKLLLFVLISALYLFSVPFCFLTTGEPRRIAMLQAQKLLDEKWIAEVSVNASIVQSDFVAAQGFIPFSETVINDEFESNENPKSGVDSLSNNQQTAWLLSFFGPSKEQKRAKAEFEKWQKQFKERSGDTVSLPPDYLPSAWACLALFLTISIHALFHLMCHWIVKFRAVMLFKPTEKVDEECFVLIFPPASRGGGALVPLKKLNTSGTHYSLYAEFQRQKYIYTASSKLGDGAKKYKNGIFTLSAYPVNLPVDYYLSSKGITSEGELVRLSEKWGKNHVAVAIPSFFELLKLQLLSPLAIFQIFCAILWLLDEYWTYTLFSLFSVVMYEATTVFQRTRTQQMLGGMAPKPSPIYAFRFNRWTLITTKDLLPGDIISLAFKKRPSSSSSQNEGSQTSNNGADEQIKSPLTSTEDTLPCDCLLLKGSVVVNEASLTGESVPQMKDCIVYVKESNNSTSSEKLDIAGTHRVHVLFSGSSLVTVTSKGSKSDNSAECALPSPPDNGAVAFVLRTGFGSSQGSLLQMIEFSQQTVSGDMKETGLALLLLFVFALVASGYVLKIGLEKKEKTTHELLLRCVIIITSVVPRQFPMQMAVAVNMALMSLSKSGIFCTEPYRVPLAGKVTHCLFDKTGTITTDQLVPAGIINFNSSSINSGGESASTSLTDNFESNDATNRLEDFHQDESIPNLFPVTSACAETAMILAACHSLVVLDEDADEVTVSNQNEGGTLLMNSKMKLPNSNLTGDPIELAAIKAIDWHWDGKSSIATPDAAIRRHEYGLILAKQELQKLNSLPPEQRPSNYSTNTELIENDIQKLEKKLQKAVEKSSGAMYNSIQVLQRHHFSSALQRMSVVVRCMNVSVHGSSHQSSSSGDHWYCLVKGSPEALKTLIVPSHLPIWYSKTYENLARRGLRVLALAYKKVSAKERPHEQPRQWAESDLHFGGFIAFECKVRADSSIVIHSLVESDHKVAMLTGDALLTSLHVAKQVGICSLNKPNLVLSCSSKITNSEESFSAFSWEHADHFQQSRIDFKLETIPSLYEKYNLLTTEEVFLAVCNVSGGKHSSFWSYVRHFKVFARMSPQGKANMIKAIQDSDTDFHVFMCGDGGNDVGALKQVTRE
jgi:manganese-transporting P-type ATPase